MHRTHDGFARRALAMAIVLAGCTSDAEGGDDDGLTVAGELGVSRDELGGAHAHVGGETVDDVEIVHVPGGNTLSVGGLMITADVLTDYREVGVDVVLPHVWPTLRVLPQIHADPTQFPELTWAVLAQTTLVTGDGARSRLLDRFWTSSRAAASEPIHVSTTEGGGVTCHVEIRRRAGVAGPVEHAVVLFAGPGLASSALGVLDARDEPDAAPVIGAVVESACGARPAGL